MEETFHDERAPVPVVGFTMMQAQYEAIIAEEEHHAQPAQPFFVFQMPQEEQGYNPRPLEQHRLTEGHITGEHANEDDVAVIAAENPDVLDEQANQSMCSARDFCHERWRLHVLRAKSDALCSQSSRRKRTQSRRRRPRTGQLRVGHAARAVHAGLQQP